MKTSTFLKWYALIVLAIAAVPSIFMALIMLIGTAASGMPDAMLFAAGATFAATFIVIALTELYPAIIVLLVGVVLCLILNSSKSSAG